MDSNQAEKPKVYHDAVGKPLKGDDVIYAVDAPEEVKQEARDRINKKLASEPEPVNPPTTPGGSGDESGNGDEGI